MLERAALLTEGRARTPWDAASWAATVLEDVRGAPDTWRPWSGGARRAAARPCVSGRGAPRITIPKELTEECLRGGSAPPNGSRLSCGASADGRKRPALRYELVGAQTWASSENRPRQLQAHVRLPQDKGGWVAPVRGAHPPPTTHGGNDSGACHHTDRTSCSSS